MSTELAHRNGTATPVAVNDYTAEKIDLIKRTIFKDSTHDELALFVQQCRRTGLDPFSKQIHAVKRGGRLTIQVGIDGLRLIAERTGESDGQDGPYWCGEDGVWKDVWLGTAKPAAAKVTVYRKGHSRGYTGVARWAEYYQSAGGMWDKLPTTMIAKVAESIALRKGFPQELSGLYTDDEMGQASPHGSPDDEADERTPRQLQAAPPDDDPAARLTRCATLGELAFQWGKLTTDQQSRLVAVKDARKAELSKPQPAVTPEREPGVDDEPADDAGPIPRELFGATGQPIH